MWRTLRAVGFVLPFVVMPLMQLSADFAAIGLAFLVMAANVIGYFEGMSRHREAVREVCDER